MGEIQSQSRSRTRLPSYQVTRLEDQRAKVVSVEDPSRCQQTGPSFGMLAESRNQSRTDQTNRADRGKAKLGIHWAETGHTQKEQNIIQKARVNLTILLE